MNILKQKLKFMDLAFSKNKTVYNMEKVKQIHNPNDEHFLLYNIEELNNLFYYKKHTWYNSPWNMVIFGGGTLLFMFLSFLFYTFDFSFLSWIAVVGFKFCFTLILMSGISLILYEALKASCIQKKLKNLSMNTLKTLQQYNLWHYDKCAVRDAIRSKEK